MLTPSWFAFFPEGIQRVNIERATFQCEDGPCNYHYVSWGDGRVGVWPGVWSDEWIEVVW